MNPFRERWGNAVAYRFYFGEFVAYVKVSRAQFPKQFHNLALTQSTPLFVVARDFSSSKDLGAMARMARESEAARNSRNKARDRVDGHDV
jgi:hypothetical protein